MVDSLRGLPTTAPVDIPSATSVNPGPAPVPEEPVQAPAVDDAAPADPGIPSPEPKSADVGNMMFEDFFPPLDLSEEQKKNLAKWFTKDLKKCVRHVNKMKRTWAMYRATFMLEYFEKFYPSVGLGANFPSGLLCEKVLEGMDRIQKAVFTPRPLFVVDDKTSNLEDIDFIHRAEWFQHSYFENELFAESVLSPQGIFEFILDGSVIVEADQMYEKIPQRTLKTYTSLDELMADSSKVLDQSMLADAMDKLTNDKPAKVLIEEELLTKNGQQIFLVDKVDHLVPPKVYNERDLKFRGRRMYLTASDMQLLASDGVNWYKQVDVDKVLQARQDRRVRRGNMGEDAEDYAKERLCEEEYGMLAYQWHGDEDTLKADKTTRPYRDTWAVYRITCKYGYKTESDPKGLIPKFCVFDFEPESQTILRARTFPSFTERKNWFHFKLSFAPDSYYGFGYGGRLIQDDWLAANAIGLYMEGAAMATFKPFLCVHPEFSDAIVPFQDGMGPGKIGYVKNITDFQQFEIAPPTPALIAGLLPIIDKRSENKTSITSLVQGQTQSKDPRSPARKAQMLLREAEIGIDSQIDDWNKTGWNALADYTWETCYQNLVYQGKSAYEDMIAFEGDIPELENTNKITLEELKKKVHWKSQASATFLNSELRTATFIKQFEFFSPLLQTLGAINPDLFKKYFLRWLRTAARELQLRGFRYLIPTAKELNDMPMQELAKLHDAMLVAIRSGQAPGQMEAAGRQQ